MKYHVYRTHLSGYWPKNFLDLEASYLEKLEQCSYHGLELDSSKWHPRSIILSNTHFNPLAVSLANWDKVDLVLHANSGYDNLLVDNSKFLALYTGPILIAPHLRAQAVAEYNVQAWFNGLGTIPFHKDWDYARSFKRRLAQQEKILILGYGHVGKATYKLVAATGAEVHVYDPFIHLQVGKHDDKIRFIHTINWQDYSTIIFCASLTPSSQKLLSNKNDWKQLRSDLILINATRGPLLDLQLAVEFAHKHPSAKIFLDVFSREPYHDFSHLPENIYTTSHIAGVHDNLLSETHTWHYNAIADFIQQGAEKFLQNRPCENLRSYNLQLLHMKE